MKTKAANCKHYTRPLWSQHDRLIWSQDTQAPDAETCQDAWLRLFGETLDVTQAVDSVDLGDTIGWLMPNGYVCWNYCDGAQISRPSIISIIG